MNTPQQIDTISIPAFLLRGSISAHDKPVLSAPEWPQLSGSEVHERVLHLSGALAEAGVTAGERVALAGVNLIEDMLWYWALVRLGALPILGAPSVLVDRSVATADESDASALRALLDVRLDEERLRHERERPLDGDAAEDAYLSWSSGQEPLTGRALLGARTHRQVAYTGLFGTFAVNTDREHRIAVLGQPGPALFEALLFASLVGGAYLCQVGRTELAGQLERSDKQPIDTWVVTADHADTLIASLHQCKQPASQQGSLIIEIDAAKSVPHDLPQWAAAGIAQGWLVRPLLVGALDGILAEYTAEEALWQGFPGVQIGVATRKGIETEPGANGILSIRSPQASLDRLSTDGTQGFYADGWSRLPGLARLKENGFSWSPGCSGDQVGAFAPFAVLDSDQRAWAGEIDVTALLQRSARWREHHPAIETDGRRATYGSLLQRVEQLMRVLAHVYGVAAGDRVAVIGRNSVEFVIIYLAANALGAIFVPINFRLKAAEVIYALKDSGAKLLLHSPELAELAQEVDVKLAGRLRAVGIDPKYTISPGRDGFPEHLPPAQRAAPDERRPASILYTAGTTGFPKGAVRSNRNVLWFSFLGLASEMRTRRAQTFLVTTPMFHITGHEPAVVGALTAGGFTLIRSEFKVNAVLELLVRHSIASLFIPPTIGFDLLDRIEELGLADRLRSFRYWSSASAPLPAVLLERIHAVLPWVEVTNTLGMTEAGSIASHLAAPSTRYPAGCIGRAVLAAEVGILDDQGRLAPPGIPGEIVVRSPQVISAYWNNPEATASTQQGGWFHGGDVGEYDTQGNIEIKGRVKDMIITGGENVYAAEVENVMLGFPEVKEAAVFGRPDPRWGESVNAALVLRPDSTLSEAEVIERCRMKIAHYKSPRRVIFLESLPRNPIGKVMKFAIDASAM